MIDRKGRLGLFLAAAGLGLLLVVLAALGPDALGSARRSPGEARAAV